MPVVEQDEALLAAIGAGDEQALAALYDRYARPAYGLALRVLRDSVLAEDAVQEAFVQVWRTAARFDPQRGSAGAWIMTFVHRRAIDLVRRAERERRPFGRGQVTDCYLHPPPAAPTRSTEEEASLRERRTAVRAALGRLPAGQRVLIELAYFDGLTQSELAERLGLPLGTVKSRTFAGLSRLRALLAGQEEAEPRLHGALARTV